jgi:hypothetical protein
MYTLASPYPLPPKPRVLFAPAVSVSLGQTHLLVVAHLDKVHSAHTRVEHLFEVVRRLSTQELFGCEGRVDAKLFSPFGYGLRTYCLLSAMVVLSIRPSSPPSVMTMMFDSCSR